MARPADAGKRAQSDPPSYLRPHRARSKGKASARSRAADCFGPAERSGRTRSAPRRTHFRSPRGLLPRPRMVQRRSGEAGSGAAQRACPSPLLDPAGLSIGSLNPSHGDWPGMVCSNIPLGQSAMQTTVIIEPQVPDYRPRTPELRSTDVLALSRFAYLRRRGDAMVLESPRAGALFRICDPEIASTLALLSTPQQVGRLRRREGFPGLELLALLVDCQILFRVDPAHKGNLRPVEGDADLVLWDFHDLLFHTRSTRAGTPIRSAEFIHTRPSRLRRRRCGAAGLARRSICARSRAPLLRSRQPRGCCVNVIRSAASTASGRSRSPSLRDFSTAPRVSCPLGKPRRPWRRPPAVRLRDAAVSIRGRKLRARALSRGRQVRRADARILSLRRRPACARTDRGAHPATGSAVPRGALAMGAPATRKSSSPSRRGSAGSPGNTAHSPMRSS